MGVLNRAADVAQRGAVLGLMSLFGYQVYQIGRNVTEKSRETKNVHLDAMQKINKKVEDEEKDRYRIDKVPDRYDPEDSSYLKNVPRLNEAGKR